MSQALIVKEAFTKDHKTLVNTTVSAIIDRLGGEYEITSMAKRKTYSDETQEDLHLKFIDGTTLSLCITLRNL